MVCRKYGFDYIVVPPVPPLVVLPVPVEVPEVAVVLPVVLPVVLLPVVAPPAVLEVEAVVPVLVPVVLGLLVVVPAVVVPVVELSYFPWVLLSFSEEQLLNRRLNDNAGMAVSFSNEVYFIY
jgi:hypothetical protein